MATELLDLYAHRRVSDGYAFAPETRWQREMESAFLYEDTPDQRKAWEDVRADMETPRIMDRLVDRPREAQRLARLRSAVELVDRLPFEVDLWRVENRFYSLSQEVYPELR